MNFFDIIGGLGGVVSLASNLYNFGLDRDKYNSSVAQFNANQSNIQTGYMREDNAVQRRVEDLKKAGLSPVLAAGSPASASISTASPTISGGGGMTDMSPLIGATYDNMKAQNRKIEEEVNTEVAKQENLYASAGLSRDTVDKNVMEKARIKADTILKSAQYQQTLSQTRLTEKQKLKVMEETRQKFIDNEIAKSSGHRTSGPKSTAGQVTDDWMNILKNAIRGVTQ